MSELITLNLCAQESAPYIMLLLQHYPNTKQFHPLELYTVATPTTTENQAAQLRIQVSHILLAFNKPAAGAPDDKAPPAARYYAVVKDELLGRGSFGSVRPIRGTWKIEDGQALFKIKPDIYKQRVLKTLFFTLEPINAQHTATTSPELITTSQQYRETKRRNEQRDALAQEQIIASYTPHLSTKYPIIETDEGVHLLMRKQPGVNLRTIIRCLQINQQQISVIQRLLLCLELYETLEQEVHSVTTANNGKLIHRDIKPENIMICQKGHMFKTHVLDYGLSTSSNAKRIPGFFGTPLYMDPEVLNDHTSPPSAANDLFALAIVCAQIWGDTKRQSLAPGYLIKENQEIGFNNLFTNIPCSEELKHTLFQLFNYTTLYNCSERLSREATVLEYKQLLLKEYNNITTTSPELAQRLDILNRQLQNTDYQRLDYAARMKFDKEYLAADFLVHLPEHVNQYNRGHSLYAIWGNYSNEQLNRLRTASIHKDAPVTLARLAANLNQQYRQIYLAPTVATLNPIIHLWGMLSRLSNMFARLVELIPESIGTIHCIFNNALCNGHIDDKKIATINTLVYEHLENYFQKALPDNVQCKQRINNLCLNVVEQTTRSDSEIFSEWSSAIRLLNLDVLLDKLGIANADELNKALKPEYSFDKAFQSLYGYFKQCIIKKITPVEEFDNQLSYTPLTLFDKIKPTPIKNFLLSKINLIFQDFDNEPHQIPQEFSAVLHSFREQLNQLKSHDIQYNKRLDKLIASVELIEKEILGLIERQQPQYQGSRPDF